MNNLRKRYIAQSKIEILSTSGKKHVALIYGGMSSEREISISSATGVKAALLENGYQVTAIDMGADIGMVLAQIKPDLVFNCLHGTYGEDGCIQGLLNIMNIPYTHSGLLSSSLCFNKLKTIQILRDNNINVSQSITVKKSDNFQNDPMPRPYVIKPLCEGSSVGVQIIFPEDDFKFSDYEFEYGEVVIIEKYIKGKELQVPILNSKALGVLEIEILKNRFYDYETKYSDGFANHIFPARISDRTNKYVMETSEKIYEIMGCTGIARAEFIYSENEDKLYCLEINTHPGMTPLSICPEVAKYVGIDFNFLVEMIISTASFGC